MNILEAIHTRRTIFKFKPGDVPKEVNEKIFEAGLWVPNHHLTEPWRFVVLGTEDVQTTVSTQKEYHYERIITSINFGRSDSRSVTGFQRS